nr:MAG TPA: hypothetical protein [Caudoviricetes sp.]
MYLPNLSFHNIICFYRQKRTPTVFQVSALVGF